MLNYHDILLPPNQNAFLRDLNRRKRLKQPEPVRHYDCSEYDACLCYAAKHDIRALPCAGCDRYSGIKKTPVSDHRDPEQSQIYFQRVICEIFRALENFVTDICGRSRT